MDSLDPARRSSDFRHRLSFREQTKWSCPVSQLGSIGRWRRSLARILQPPAERGACLVLFGNYKGSVRTSGFYWANPFYSNGRQRQASLESRMAGTKSAPVGPAQRPLGRNRISLRARTLNGEKLKVNDKRGNPIEIAAVVVWRIEDTARAFFDVDNYENYVPIQSESALRHLANMYAYDDGEGGETTLRSNVDEVSLALRRELEERFSKAGVP